MQSVCSRAAEPCRALSSVRHNWLLIRCVMGTNIRDKIAPCLVDYVGQINMNSEPWVKNYIIKGTLIFG